MEEKIKKNENKQTTTEKILWTIFNLLEHADDVYHLFAAPYPAILKNLNLSIEYKDIIRRLSWQKERGRFDRFINKLKQTGYLKTRIEKDKKVVILTTKGFEKILKISLKRFQGKKRCDGRWQMIIWDIPENYKKTRNRFRTALKLLGYQQLQKSAWVCPFDILEETEKLIRFYNIELYVRLFLISEVKRHE